MGIAWPAALLGLIALAVPLLIHLLARGEFQRVTVATTRFVRERPRLRWRRLQISHPLLLALRMALIALCVLLIAQPFHKVAGNATDSASWTLVSVEVDAAAARSLAGAAKPPARWLAPGFPSIDEPRPAWPAAQLWSAMDAANHLAPADVGFTLIAPAMTPSPGAVRPTLGRALSWVTAPAISRSAARAAPLSIDIVYDQNRRQDMDEIVSVIAAWRDAGLDASANTLLATGERGDAPFAIWLSSAALPPDNPARVVVAERPLLDAKAIPIRFGADGSVALSAQHAAGIDVRILQEMFATDGTPRDGLARDLLEALISTQLYTPPLNYPVNLEQLTNSNTRNARLDTPIEQPLTTLFFWLIALVAALERLLGAALMRSSDDG